ncbi:hypothetical protein RRG08_020867 [Elysia crispata]|uniref:Uncharacterized protein n=1 Tax=Elysia crispata TaxID=231223 RepID=A0AAE0XV83_9GAST|nr:hypothetical protein RRG08_020867 [Elysia crispata]
MLSFSCPLGQLSSPLAGRRSLVCGQWSQTRGWVSELELVDCPRLWWYMVFSSGVDIVPDPHLAGTRSSGQRVYSPVVWI